MPQKCQILGANSVTNIEPEAGVMPAPIIRNADWFENLNPLQVPGLALLPYGQGPARPGVQAVYACAPLLYVYRVVANGRFTRGECNMTGYCG